MTIVIVLRKSQQDGVRILDESIISFPPFQNGWIETPLSHEGSVEDNGMEMDFLEVFGKRKRNFMVDVIMLGEMILQEEKVLSQGAVGLGGITEAMQGENV